jgi:hypothetical protein
MAYVDFSMHRSLDALIAPAPAPVQPPVVAPLPEPRFSALEWSVIAVARRDRLSSLRRPGRMAMALGQVFGTNRHNPRLADATLEALRRMAVLSWYRGFAVPAHEVAAFLDAGFTLGQYETMLASISAARSRRRAHA